MTEVQQFELVKLFSTSVEYESELRYVAKRLNELFPEDGDWRPRFQGHCPDCGIPNPYPYPPESSYYYENSRCEPCLDKAHNRFRPVGPQNVPAIFKDIYEAGIFEETPLLKRSKE